jgi:hypothetical protein
MYYKNNIKYPPKFAYKLSTYVLIKFKVTPNLNLNNHIGIIKS